MADLRPVYVAGDGDVKGPASSSNNFLPLFADTTGKLLKSSGTGVTTQGLAILDDNTPAEQRKTIGLDQVDNTPDIHKPVSTAQQAALKLKQDKLQYTPVQQGGGVGQAPKKIFIGFGTGRLKATVDSKDLGNFVFDGNAATESVVGVSKVATTAIATAGTNDTDMMTPLKTRSAIKDRISALGTAATKTAQTNVSDFTPSRLALVGSGGVGGGTIGYASSVDNLTAGQFFSTGHAVTGLPSWAASSQGQGHYIHLNSNYGYMRWTEITTGVSYERAKVSGVWQAWGECYGQVNFDITGAIMTFPTNAAPAGFLKANGAAISRTAYSRLFAKIGTTYGAGDGSKTFNVPELRGEFIRGFSDGRVSVDAGRAIGSYQLGSLVSYDPTTISPVATGLHSKGSDANTRKDLGVDIPEASAAYPNANVIASGGVATYAVSAAAGVSRPRNVALLFCIKY